MNPYAPPGSEVGRAEPTSRRPVALVVLGLTLLQFVWLLRYMGAYLELVRTGAGSVVTALCGFVGCLLLYAGAAYFAANATRGNRLFLISCVLLALSVLGWRLQYAWSYPYVFGSAIAISGWWFSRRRAAAGDGDG